MRGLIVMLFAVVAFSSCQKNNLTPTSAASSGTTATASTANTANTPDSATVLHTVTLSAKSQIAKTSVTDSTLNVAVAQDVSILVATKGYSSTYAIYLVGDFSNSILAKFNFYSSSTSGVTTYNYIENNLNYVDFKTVTDTTVNNTAMKKVHVQRTINFVKRFATPTIAANAQKVALSITTDPVTYSSYVYYNKNYPATSASTRISYY